MAAVSHRDTVSTYAVPTLVGIAMAVAAYAVSLPLLLWMMPVILGLLLSIPIAMLSSSSGPNRRSRLFKTPEQTAPPSVLTRANELASAPHSPLACPLHELRQRCRSARSASEQSFRTTAAKARRGRSASRDCTRKNRRC